MDQFWLTDEQFAKIAPHLPNDTRFMQRQQQRADEPPAARTNVDFGGFGGLR